MKKTFFILRIFIFPPLLFLFCTGVFIAPKQSFALSPVKPLLNETYFSSAEYNGAKNFSDSSADNPKYLRVITDDTPFYSNADMTDFLFFLPYTYYVKVIDNVGETVHAEIGSDDTVKLDGYIPKNMLFDDGLKVENPYPVITLTSAKNTVLYNDEYLNSAVTYVFPSRQMQYYGYAKLGKENIYFVSYNHNLGYVKENDLLPFSVANHPNPLTFIKQTDANPTDKQSAGDSGNSNEKSLIALRIIIVVCLVMSTVIGLIISIRKKPNPAVNYEEADVE